jgi:hypothetical protein
MIDKFKAEYAKKDKIPYFFFLNSRVMESETAKEVRMEDGAHVECFNFLNFFWVEICWRWMVAISMFIFALKPVDEAYLDAAI